MKLRYSNHVVQRKLERGITDSDKEETTHINVLYDIAVELGKRNNL